MTPIDALRDAKVGDLVSTMFDTGGGKTGGYRTLYGFVERAGPKTLTIRWESDLTNRVSRDDSHGVVPMRPDLVEDALATFARLGLKVPDQRTPGVTPAQAKMLEDVRVAGERVYNGRARRTIEALERAGLVTAKYDMQPHAKGSVGFTLTERITVCLTPKP